MSTGIEYGHIYTDQKFGVQHERSVEELHKVEKALGEHAVRIVLIDDYSPDEPLEGFSPTEFTDKLADLGGIPDVVVNESALVPFAMQTLEGMKDGKQKRGLEKYIESKGKVPCSLFIAAWYLYRLDALDGEIETVQGDAGLLKTDKLVTVLPESFVTPETKADEIIRDTPHASLLANVERHYFEYEEPEYSPFELFGTEEYVERNYLRDVLPEDRSIIRVVTNELKAMGLKSGSIKKAADIGVGPNLYPSLMISPFVAQDGSIDLIDYAQQNLDYVQSALDAGKRELPFTGDWGKFEHLITGELDKNATVAGLAEVANVKQGDIFNLPKEEYDLITSFFVADSITDDRAVYEKAVKSMMDSLKEGGIFIMANMLDSKQYYAGEREYYPSVNMNAVQYIDSFGQYGDFYAEVVSHGAGTTSAREGYSGMIVTVGKKITLGKIG